jgi:two-component system sensor histidine kinase PhoQ
LAPAVDIAALIARLERSLGKVYAHKNLQLDVEVAPGTGFRGDEGDLMEILGNVLDNACKWARARVRVRVEHAGTGGLTLHVDDDGPGIPQNKLDSVLVRGVRADASTPGHGIGLAVVRDLVVEVYGGQVAVGAGDLGGAAVTVRIPPR